MELRWLIEIITRIISSIMKIIIEGPYDKTTLEKGHIENKMSRNKQTISTNENLFSKNGMIKTLNYDCLVEIFQYLPIADRIRSERVCKLWRQASLGSWKNFRHLSFTDELWGNFVKQKVTTSTMTKIVRRFRKQVTHFEISLRMKKSFELQQDVMMKPLKMCPNLVSVILTAVNVGIPECKSLMKNCKNLTELRIVCTEECVNDAVLRALIQKLKKLKVFEIFGHLDIQCFFLLDLPKSIEELNLIGCKIKNLYPKNDLNWFPNIKKLNLDSTIYGRFDLNILSRMNLKELDISCNNYFIEDSHLVIIALTCENLSTFIMQGNDDVTNEGVAAICTLPNLEKLDISYVVKVTDEAFTCMPRLKNFHCAGTGVSDVTLMQLLYVSKNIEIINCQYCKKVTNNFISSAITATRSRTNGIKLSVFVLETGITSDFLDINLPQLRVCLYYDKTYVNKFYEKIMLEKLRKSIYMYT